MFVYKVVTNVDSGLKFIERCVGIILGSWAWLSLEGCIRHIDEWTMEFRSESSFQKFLSKPPMYLQSLLNTRGSSDNLYKYTVQIIET